jgi:hypothetical protein
MDTKTVTAKSGASTVRFESRCGRIACYEHVGMEAQAHLRQEPNATEFETVFTTWYRMTDAEVSDFVAFMAKCGDTSTEVCETCRWGGSRLGH